MAPSDLKSNFPSSERPRTIEEMQNLKVEDIQFPLYLKYTETGRYVRYSDGNKTLEFDSHSVSSHANDFISMTRVQFIRHLTVLKKWSYGKLITVSEKEFYDEIAKAIEYMVNEGIEPREYWTEDMIKRNNLARAENERKFENWKR